MTYLRENKYQKQSLKQVNMLLYFNILNDLPIHSYKLQVANIKPIKLNPSSIHSCFNITYLL